MSITDNFCVYLGNLNIDIMSRVTRTKRSPAAKLLLALLCFPLFAVLSAFDYVSNS